MIPGWISHGLYITAGVSIATSGVLGFLDETVTVDYIILQCYIILIGVLTVFLEFHFPTILLSTIPFYRHLVGRFIYLLFCAALAFGELQSEQIILGIWVCLVALYTILLRVISGEIVCTNPIFSDTQDVF